MTTVEKTRALLTVRGVTKRFGGVHALSEVSIDLRPGEIHAIVGENGAGKSTLIKIIAGILSPDEGTIDKGNDTTVSVVHQELSVVPALSVLDNLFLGDPRVRGIYRRRRLLADARQLLDRVGLADVHLRTKASELSLAEQQLIEIARSLARQARVTVLDEPTATLSDAEIERIFEVVRSLRDQDHAVVYISHRLGEVFALADRVTTLRNGRVVVTQRIDEVNTAQLVAQMIGALPGTRDFSIGRAPDLAAAPVLEIRNGRSSGQFTDLSLTVRAGEIVGVLGQVGSGADAVVRAVAGIDRDFDGGMSVGGAHIAHPTLARTRRLGVSYLSESRKDDGVFLGFTCETNAVSPVLPEVSTAGWMRPRRARSRAHALLGQMAVAPAKFAAPVVDLSGGNQQKVALAKALASGPRLLVLNEPTRGVDVGARAEIYQHLRRLAAEGMGVLCYTSDVTEVTEMCDRVVTMFRGRVVTERTVTADAEPELLQDILHGGEARR